jgi:hypothetical protein
VGEVCAAVYWAGVQIRSQNRFQAKQVISYYTYYTHPHFLAASPEISNLLPIFVEN